MKGKTSVGADKLFDMYEEVQRYDTWDEFWSDRWVDYPPLCVYIGKKLYFLLDKTKEEK